MKRCGIFGFMGLNICVLLLSFVIMPAGGQASPGLIEPFVQAPFGAHKMELEALAGEPESRGHNTLTYHENIMNIPMEVNYHFSAAENLLNVNVSFKYKGITGEEAARIVNEISEMVQARLNDFALETRKQQRDAFEEEPAGRVYALKQFLLDETHAVILGFWWHDTEHLLAGELYFTAAGNQEDDVVKSVKSLVCEDMTVQNLLQKELNPFFGYTWSTTPRTLKKDKGQPTEEVSDWGVTKLHYDEEVFGVPVRTSAAFFRDFMVVGFKHLVSYDVSFTLHGLTMEEAHVVAEKISVLMEAGLQKPQGYRRVRIRPHAESLGPATWTYLSEFLDDDTHAFMVFRWRELYGSCLVSIFLAKADFGFFSMDTPAEGFIKRFEEYNKSLEQIAQ